MERNIRYFITDHLDSTRVVLNNAGRLFSTMPEVVWSAMITIRMVRKST